MLDRFKHSAFIFNLLIGCFLVVLNNTLITPALPSIMHWFQIDSATVQLLSSGFKMIDALLIPVTAFFIDKFSAKRLFIAAMFIFTLGSLVCFFAPSFYILFAGRILQGLGAGTLLNGGMTIFLWSFSQERRGWALGIWNICNGVAPLIGPTISGLIVDNLNWQFIFIIDFVIGIFIILCSFFTKDVYESNNSDLRLNIPSLIFSSFGLGLILMGLSTAGSKGFHLTEIFMIVSGVILLTIFTKLQCKMELPMLRVDLLKNKNFLYGTIILMLLSTVLSATVILLSIYVQDVLGHPATTYALIGIPGSLLNLFSFPIAGIIHDKFGPRNISIFGIFMLAGAVVSFCLLDFQTSLFVLVVLLAIRVSSRSFVNIPINIWSLNYLDDSVLNHGVSISNTLRKVSASLGVALVMGIENLASNFFMNNYGLDSNVAYLFGINTAFAFCAILVLISLVLAIMLIKDKVNPVLNTNGKKA